MDRLSSPARAMVPSLISFSALTVKTRTGQRLVEEACGGFSAGAMNAVIGPSGCGKTTLVKGILGLAPQVEGEVFLQGERLERRDELVGIAGFAPQFSIAHRKLTVEECMQYSLDLLVADAGERKRRYGLILRLVGLEEHAEKLVENLSGGQLRRLGLGLELVTDPACLFCDEVTSGLDPQSEEQILELLGRLCRDQEKTVVCVIHNLARLSLFSNITVLYQGRLVFQGALEPLLGFFGIADAHFLYDRLDERPVGHWVAAWERERKQPPDEQKDRKRGSAARRADEPGPLHGRRFLPSWQTQFWHLLRRRFHLLIRDRGSLALTLGITFGFPLLVVIFALGGLPQLESMALEYNPNLLETMRTRAEFEISASRTAALVSGLVMFQVILLTLMGSNNGAREIAGERQVYEKERLSGLRPGAYLAGKACFVTLIALGQGAWMTFFVKTICGFPGPWGPQILALAGATVAMSLISLGFSALLHSPERASLLSVYLVGFQLPLSGAVLALPESLVWIIRPFITAYWSWAGYLSTMKETRLYDAVVMFSEDWFAPPGMAVAVMAIQGAVGIAMAFWGCQRRQWD
jgi:ABC transport system ATP-binding/permease protein